MRWTSFLFAACLLANSLWAASGVFAADEPEGEADASGPKERIAPPIDPQEMGLNFPDEGPVTPGGGRRVLRPDEANQPVVAQLLCEVQDVALVILPSGRLKSVKRGETTLTERPFVPMKAADLLARLHSGPFKVFKTATSDHYAYLYGCTDNFYQATRDILESLHDGVIDSLNRWKAPVQPLEAPLVVLIMPDRATFDAFHRMPAGVLAYYSPVTNFVVLYEDPELSDAAPEFALKRAAYTIAHEGVHQILHNVGIQKRLAPWPAWFSEGLPELFCPVKITSSMVKEGTSSMPRRRLHWSRLGLVNDLRMKDLLGMRPDKGVLIETTVGAKALGAGGYAVAWGLGHYLMTKQPKQFQGYLQAVSAIETLANRDQSNRGAENKALFGQFFGSDFAQLETDVGKYLLSETMQSNYRDPRVYQTYYLVVHSARRGRAISVTMMITSSPDGARRWRAEEEKKVEKGMVHDFRTQAFETLKQAQAVFAKLGRR